MRAAELRRVAKAFVPTDEDWPIRGRLCYRAPVSLVAAGVLVEGSPDKGVYVWAVSMPLFVPSDVVVLSYSRRVGGGARKYYPDNLRDRDEAIGTAIRSAPTQDQALAELAAMGSELSAGQWTEVAGYAQVLLGQFEQAQSTPLSALTVPATYAWDEELHERVRSIRALLLEGDDVTAVAQLRSWSASTANALGLKRSSDG